jgi:DNA-binding CsgD family transcriptional regulator
MNRRRTGIQRRRLSKRQTQVLRALAAGVAPAAIAADLGIQIATVRVVRHHIRQKIRRRSVAGQFEYVIRHNLFNPLAGPAAGPAGDVAAPTRAVNPGASGIATPISEGPMRGSTPCTPQDPLLR